MEIEVKKMVVIEVLSVRCIIFFDEIFCVVKIIISIGINIELLLIFNNLVKKLVKVFKVRYVSY